MKFKSLMVTFVLAFVIVSPISAQFELKINPVGGIFGPNSIGEIFSNPNIFVEYGIAPRFGVEGTLSLDFRSHKIIDTKYKNRGFGVRVTGKYYFNPNSSIDKWYAGIYTKLGKGKLIISNDTSPSKEKIKPTRLAIGFLFGHKWVIKHNLVLELNAGFGRAFEYGNTNGGYINTFLPNLDVVGTFAIGYRFGGKNN